MIRSWPRSLAGQTALLIAIALFVAQAINAGLLLRERSAARLDQATTPSVIRFVDATDRLAQGRSLNERGRVRQAAANPITATMSGEPAVADAVRQGLADAGVRPVRIVAGLRSLSAAEQRRYRARFGGRGGRTVDELVIAIERRKGEWLVQRVGWPRPDSALFARLIAQTLVLYGAVLLPVLWITRRITRPLRALTAAAERFGAAGAYPPAPEPPRGPHDVAALVRAYNALQLRVSAMLEEKDRMLGAIGHDLRTPLAALRVRVESVEDDTDRSRMAAIIAEMSQTLDDILSLARIGRSGEAIVEVDVAALVDAVVEDFRDLGHAVAFEAPARLTTRLRPALMRRAIRNLIENAVKYGGDAAVSVEDGAAGVSIAVTDRGPGIADDQLGPVFEAFTRLETSRNRDTGGAGLGLALARAIVVDAGGSVTLANRIGGGLCATIALPRNVPGGDQGTTVVNR